MKSQKYFRIIKISLFQILETLGEPHVTSFNHFLTSGMEQAIKSIEPYEFQLLNGEKLKISIESCSITRPEIPSQIKANEKRFFPAEARQRAVTYAGNCNMTLAWSRNNVKNTPIDFDLGSVNLNSPKHLHIFIEFFYSHLLDSHHDSFIGLQFGCIDAQANG